MIGMRTIAVVLITMQVVSIASFAAGVNGTEGFKQEMDGLGHESVEQLNEKGGLNSLIGTYIVSPFLDLGESTAKFAYDVGTHLQFIPSQLVGLFQGFGMAVVFCEMLAFLALELERATQI